MFLNISIMQYNFYYIQSQLKKQLPNDDPTALDWHGHKYVVDNVDKKFKPSKQRIDHPGLDIHYFHVYAIYDRVNLGDTLDVPPWFCMPDPASLAPSIIDVCELKAELQVLVSR